jgi:hypothetical protein
MLLKGTVSRNFLTLGFFFKHLLLVPLGTARKDFKFLQIFEELFESVIDSQYSHYRGVEASRCINPPPVTPRAFITGELRFPGVFTTGEWT